LRAAALVDPLMASKHAGHSCSISI
jgi:hypothetical protein